jgi:hypothetical protein
MLCSELIDQILAFSDNISPAGADYNQQRRRHLFFLREEASQTYYAREWTWRMKGTTDPHVVVAAGDARGLLPADFLSLGKLGAVYNQTQNGTPMEPAAESEVTDLIAMSTMLTNSRVYTIFGNNGGSPPQKYIYIPPTTSAVTLRLWYHPLMPTLNDSTANGGDDSEDSNLDLACPQEYQQTVLIPGVRSRARRSKGDSRWSVDRDERMQGLNEMIRNNRRFQGGEQRLPSFFGY